MRFAIRSHGALPAELLITEQPVCIGASEAADLRLDGAGIEAIHLRIDTSGVEALADCEVGGIPLPRGGRRALVPCTITLGKGTTVDVVLAEASEVPTRELVMRALEGPGLLWPHAVVVEGTSLGSTLVMHEERSYRVGRAASCDLVIDDGEASREHLEIVRRGTEILVRDLDSMGGTWLGRRRLDAGRKAEWRSDRMLRIGATVIGLVHPARIHDTPPEAPPAPAPPPEIVSELSLPTSTVTETETPSDLAEPPRPVPAQPPQVLPNHLRLAPIVALVAIVVLGVGALVYLAFAGR